MAQKGFIGVCKNWTEKECFDRMLFGSVADWFGKVSQVRKGDIGFLLNLDSDTLYGAFRAESDGQMNIEPTAWRGHFPAQVRVSWEKQFTPIGNAQSTLKGLGITMTNYVLTPDETLALRKLLENPDDLGVVTVRTGHVGARKERTMFRTDDGHYVRSKSEALIDNWLYGHGLAHAYERRPPIPEDLLSDFYVPPAKCYIEYWGLEDEEYLKRKQAKIELYSKHGLKLIELREAEIANLDDILGKLLGSHIRD